MQSARRLCLRLLSCLLPVTRADVYVDGTVHPILEISNSKVSISKDEVSNGWVVMIDVNYVISKSPRNEKKPLLQFLIASE